MESDRKSALVTGASRGIGRSIAFALAKEGYNIGVNYKSSSDKAAEVCEIIKSTGVDAIPIHGDISILDDIDDIFHQFLDYFGKIDVLVNNAGVTKVAPFLETTEELWQQVTNTDWKGSFFCTQHAAKNMIEQQIRGVIINITSNQQEGCWPTSSVYGPTKAALDKFTRHAALELAPYGIRVLSVAPGYTTSNENCRKQNRISQRIPMNRFASYEEVAEATVFLVSDKAAYITGTCLKIDGGALLPIVVENSFI